jgi:hypothetical protein
MAGKGDTPIKGEMAVRVRLGAPILETGYTLVPNLLLDHYETLGLTDSTAIFVIRLLRQGASHRGALPNSPQTREHLKALQGQGLISVRRWPDGIQVHLDALFHNLVRLADWLTEGHSPDDFKPEVPAEMLGGDEFETTRFDSAEFEAEMTDVLAAFAAANQRAASPAEKEQIHNLAVRFDAAARAAVEPSNGPAWVMAALRSALEQKSPGEISVLDLERALESRMSTDGTATPTAKTVRREVSARVQKMGTQEKEALGTVLMAYRGVAGHPPDDRLVLTLMQWSDEYGLTWVLNAIHEAGKVQQLISPEYVESILMRWRSEGHIPGAPAAAKSPPLTDPLLVRVVALYEQEVAKLTPQTQAQLLALTQEFRDVDEWARAFAEAAKSNARSLRYVEAVLRKKGKKPAPASRRSIGSHRQRGAVRESAWTEEELEAARREALSEAPIDVESFLGEEA